MLTLVFVGVIVLLGLLVAFLVAAAHRSEGQARAAEEHAAQLEAAARRALAEKEAADRRVQSLSRFFGIEEADAVATQIRSQAQAAVLLAKAEVDRYEGALRAIKGAIDGYGDEYLKPARGLLDQLATGMGHRDAAAKLKAAREFTRQLVKERKAAPCEHPDPDRRRCAENLLLDAFNGRVDAALARVKHDNTGKLEQQIRDWFEAANVKGGALWNARITEGYLDARLQELRWGAVVQQLIRDEREEQRAIRERIRDEERALREYERSLAETQREETAIKRAMEDAEARARAATDEQRAQYEMQLAQLRERLAAAEERNQRALSMAQQTRRGHVYIVSNVGSFGDQLYKIGLTRRLDPMDRIWELADASVPFDFDVHAIIYSEDAPALETALHKEFLLAQVNKVNHRKEFFRVPLAEIRKKIESLGIEAEWTMAAEATEYRESLAIEERIKTDPEARELWLKRQLELDPVSVDAPLAREVSETADAEADVHSVEA